MIPNTPVAFPDHNIDPRKKDKEWILQYCKAVWNNWSTSMPVGSIFRAKAARYQEIADYAMGRQSIDKYKKRLLADSEEDDTWMKIDWSPRTDLMVLRNIAVAKIQKGGYNFVATPVNMNAADIEDQYYADIRSKIMMRDAIMQKDPNSPLLQSPLLKELPGEPKDLEELEMEVNYSPKLVRAKDIEESLQLVCSENDFDNYLDLITENLVDYGVGILKEYLDENNKVVIKDVKPDIFGCSNTTKNDFSDITWAFEMESIKLTYLAGKFDEEEMEVIKNKVSGLNGNPSSMGINTFENNGYDIFKADVLNVKFISYNKRVTEETRDKSGNLRMSKTDPKNIGKDNSKNKYTGKSVEVVYEGKWIIGTDFIYDAKLSENVPRSVNPKNMTKTRLGYYIIAASFNKMHASGLTEQMISIADDLCEATYKLRNFRNRMVPNGFDIDLSAIEAVPLGKGGKKLTPKEVIDMFFETGILVSRRSGISMDSNVNYKAINAIENNMADQIVSILGDIAASKQALRDITGLNELTDGSTPDAKMLTTIANLANESTNNALFFLVKPRKKIVQALGKGLVQRLQIAVKRGPYDGFNKQTSKWVTIPKSIAGYDYDIMIEDAPGEEQKQMIYQLMAEDIKAGYISHAEVVTILYTKNLKHAAMLLSYRVEKGKERLQKNSMENIQVTSQEQQKSNQAAKLLDDKMDENKHKRKMEEIELTQSWMFKTKQLEVAQASEAVDKKAITDIVTTGMAGQPPGSLPQQNTESMPVAPPAEMETA